MSHLNPYQIPFGLSSLTLTTNSGNASPDTSGNLNLIGAGNVEISGNGNQVTISVSIPGLFQWISTQGGSVAMRPNWGYIVTGGVSNFSLPQTSAAGDQIWVLLSGGTSWTISPGNGQNVTATNVSTSIGNQGSVSSTDLGNTALLVCTHANITWQIVTSVGLVEII